MDANLPTGPHPSMRTVWLIRALLATPLSCAFGVPVWVMAVAIAADSDASWVWTALWWSLLVPMVLWVVWSLVYWPLYQQRYAFRFEDETVVVKRGVWFRRTVHIPLRRVQDVTVHEGPLLGAFGLYTLHLQTAAQGQSSIAEGRLPGVRAGPEVAEHLVARIRALKGDV